MEPTTVTAAPTAASPPPTTAPLPDLRLRTGRSTAVFGITFLAAWFALDRMVTSPPTLLSATAALLAAAGVIIASEALAAGGSLGDIARRTGLGRPKVRGLVAATVAGGLVVSTYVVGAAAFGVDLELRSNWPNVLAGSLVFHGVAEELVWRGYAFARLRAGRSFGRAIAWSVPLIALTHVPIIASNGLVVGSLAVLTAAVTCIPFAYLWERSGRTVWAPAILHGLIGTWQLVERTYGDGFTVVILTATIVVPFSALLFRRGFFEPAAP